MWDLISDFIDVPSSVNLNSSSIYNIAGAVMLIVIIWFLDALKKILWR